MEMSKEKLMQKPLGELPLGAPKVKWEDNINIDLREVDW
jgi:hypothetical protein